MRARRSSGVVGATSGTSAMPAASQASRSSPDSSSGRSGTIRPLAPASASVRANATGPLARTRLAYIIITTGTRADSARQTSSTPATVAPARSAAVPAAWMTGPSASGSENGTPSSSTSAPASAAARPASREMSIDGKPPIRYGISAARFPLPSAKAADRRSPIEREDLGQVLVTAAGQRHQVELRARVLQQPGQRVGRFQRGDDPLQAGDLLERGDG